MYHGAQHELSPPSPERPAANLVTAVLDLVQNAPPLTWSPQYWIWKFLADSCVTRPPKSSWYTWLDSFHSGAMLCMMSWRQGGWRRWVGGDGAAAPSGAWDESLIPRRS